MISRDALFLQTVDVGLGKDATFARHMVQLDAVVALLAELLVRDLQLGHNLVDDCACPTRALVVHGGNLSLVPVLCVLLKNDDLCILSTKLYDRIHFGMQLFNGQ